MGFTFEDGVMKADVHAIGAHLAGLAWVALRSFAAALLGLTMAGVVLAGLSYYLLAEYYWLYGAIAVVLTLVESVTVGFILGAKRAVMMAAAHGLGELQLGRSLVSLLFERMLQPTEREAMGERGRRIAQGLERLPFGEADRMLTAAVRGVMGGEEQDGWLRRKIQGRVLEAVRKYTLARFRAEGTEGGGIDLLEVKEELAQTVDDTLVRKIQSTLRFWTFVVIIGLPLLVAVQTFVLIMLLRSKG
jgi:hypothetical protein